MARTVLYRFFDEDDRLLYVGITEDIETRWTTHASNKHWWPNIARKHVEWYDHRVAAIKAERDAIIGESPLYNVTHAPDRPAPAMPIRPKVPDGPPPGKSLYDAVIAALNEQGKSKRWLHQRSGVARTTLDAWRDQPKPPQAGTVLAVADALGIDRDRALRLGGVLPRAQPLPDGAPADLGEVPPDDLVAEINRLAAELRRRIPD